VHGGKGQCFEDEEIDAAAEGIGFGRMARSHRASSLEVEKSIRRGSLEVKR
jgi:hypothetical protein